MAIESTRTRDCTDPWKLVYLRADGQVSLCCWGPPIGALRERSLGELVQGERARRMRAALLSGELEEACRRCPARGWSTTGKLGRRVDDLLSQNRLEELRELRRRVRNLEDVAVDLRVHGRALEEQREELREERRQLVAHASAVETERDQLAKNQSAEIRELRRRARNLEDVNGGLEAHARALEKQRDEIRDERLQLVTHVSTIESERDQLRSHNANLERILRKIHGRELYGALCAVKDRVFTWRGRRG